MPSRQTEPDVCCPLVELGQFESTIALKSSIVVGYCPPKGAGGLILIAVTAEIQENDGEHAISSSSSEPNRCTETGVVYDYGL